MNKAKENKSGRRFALLLASLLATGGMTAMAQSRVVKGSVVDANNQEPLMGATITINGKTAAVTDIDGNFQFNAPESSKQISVSYIGYVAKTVQIKNGVMTVTLDSNDKQIGEVVVVGYGTTRKSDLTGSVATVKAKDFNKGSISSPEQLINGKVSGVQIMSNSGSATSGSTIRVRGGASLNASNDPLIVVDGVPLELGGISGADNFLSMINPQDIESMTVLKDAASTAIYGSRASNGVIIITTKKGSDSKLNVQFTTTNTLQTRAQMVDILSADEFRSVINQHGSDAQKALLGTASTDWYDEVYRTALSTDNNLSLSGNIVKGLPFRASVGYANQSGIIRGDKSERFTGSIVLNPSFFNDHLKLTLNAKGSITKNDFYNGSAIWAAATFNPTLPVRSGSDFLGGYTESLDANGQPINTSAGQRNPRGLVDQYDAGSDVKRFIGNFDIDYKLHFFPDVKLHATVGTDIAQGKGTHLHPRTGGVQLQRGRLRLPLRSAEEAQQLAHCLRQLRPLLRGGQEQCRRYCRLRLPVLEVYFARDRRI